MIWKSFSKIRFFGREICSGVITLHDAVEEQINLRNEIDSFKESTKPRGSSKKEKKPWFLKTQL